MLLPKIAILGCGWLGLPLAFSLQKGGHNIVATCRSKLKVIELNKKALHALQFNLGDALHSNTLKPLFSSDLLIINIPSGRKTMQTEQFVDNMTSLIAAVMARGKKKLIFVSTSSVYGDSVYADQLATITETTEVQPNTASAKAHVLIESFIKQRYAQDACIIRLAGLVGQDRHPAKFLAGKTELSNPSQVVNLIHQSDVIRAIQKVIKLGVWGETLHLSCSEHPTRKDYYTWAANKLKLVTPVFSKSTSKQCGKQIDAAWSLMQLNLSLKYPSPFDMLD
jgi:nucleoside-diphosphate-sugar epimerase